MLIPLALLPVYFLGDERLVNQLLWDNKLGFFLQWYCKYKCFYYLLWWPTEGQVCLRKLRTRFCTQ